MALDRAPPQNNDAEKGLLGSILLDNHVIDDVADVLSADDFYLDRHQRIYKAIQRLHETGTHGFDALTVAEGLAKNNELKDKNDGQHIAEAEGLQKDAKRFALLSDVGTGAAVICAVGTAYLYFSNSSKPVEAPKTARLRVVPAFGQTNAGMNIFGEF